MCYQKISCSKNLEISHTQESLNRNFQANPLTTENVDLISR